MRTRIKITKKNNNLVYSTNPKFHAIMCEINNKRNVLNIPISESTRIGISKHAIIKCRKVIPATKKVVEIGEFKATTNKCHINTHLLFT